MAFRCDEGQDLDDIKRRALRVLYDHSHNGGTGTDGIEGPLWALVDVSHGNERVKNGLIRKLDDAGGQNGMGCAHNRNTPLIRLQACPNTFSP